MIVARKAYAYIIHRGRLLVFRHPYALDAGIQVPGGTIARCEDPGIAVLCESEEETGLSNLTVIGLLGEATRAMSDFPLDCAPGEVHHRCFFHLQCGGEPPEMWRHYERFSANTAEPMAFDFFWAALPDEVPPLTADQDLNIPRLVASFADGQPG